MYKFDVLNVTVMIMQYTECHMQNSTVNQSLIHGFPETHTIFHSQGWFKIYSNLIWIIANVGVLIAGLVSTLRCCYYHGVFVY